MNKKYDNLTIDQMSRANALLQKLVFGVQKRWEHGQRSGLSSIEACEIIDRIYQIINEVQNNDAEGNL